MTEAAPPRLQHQRGCSCPSCDYWRRADAARGNMVPAKSFIDMTPAEMDAEVAADTNSILRSAAGVYAGMEVIHVKTGGHYIVVCEATIESTLAPAVVYRSVKDGGTWVRPTAEFCDGRFVGV